MRSLAIGATGMLAQQMNVEVISNNIANMTTTGFKRQRAEFQDLLYQNVTRPGVSSSDVGTVVPAGIQLGLGVQAAGVYRMHDQGSLTVTGSSFDLAINGKGYFEIELPNGESAYTRAGSLQVAQDGTIVSINGYRMGQGLAIPPDATTIDINESGEVWVKLDGQEDPVNIGQLELARFPNDAGLESIGTNLYKATPASGPVSIGTPGSVGFGTITQGALEQSNVNVVSEVTNLIAAQRAYEMNSKIIRTTDEMMANMNQLR